MFTLPDMLLIRALEAKKGKKKRSKQAATSGAFAALLRPQTGKDKVFRCSSRVVCESAMPLDATQPVPVSDSDSSWLEGPRVKVVLITEGLGNRRDMNYYGPEAIDSAPFVFEGAHCFLNHPSYTEERDIPERRVQDMCGYFKNVHVESIDATRAVVGELHFDRSDTGRMGYEKMLTALHYQHEFPGSDREYVGLSVNADGASEKRTINLEGEPADVNYVTKFTAAISTDIVTLPARGGKALALVESVTGAEMRNKEVRTMLVKRLQAIQTALKEAKATDDKEKQKSLLTESAKIAEALLKDALDAANRSTSTKEADGESEESEDAMEAETEEADEENGDGGDAMPAPGHTVKKTVSVSHKKDKAAADDDEEESKEAEATEANRLAVKHLIAESGLEKELFDVNDLTRRGLKEAKAEIARMKRVSESWTRRALKIVGDVSPAHAAKFNESGKPTQGGKDNTDLFAGCSH